MEKKTFSIGDLVSIKDGSSNDEPIFIWEIVEQKEKTEFLINSESGMSKNEIARKFPNQKVLLPDSTKFKLISSDNLNASYGHSAETGYSLVSQAIVFAKDSRNVAPELFINAACVTMHVAYIVKFLDSKNCKSSEERIYGDAYSLIRQPFTTKDVIEAQRQNNKNLNYLRALYLIPRRFVLLKIITKARDLVRESFPPENDLFSNSLIEKLLLGQVLGYYKSNRDKIKSITVNYSQKFPGDFKTVQHFTYMLNNFEDEMNMYESVNKEQNKIELHAALHGMRLPERDEGKGIIMKLLEFDLPFWQRLILMDIDKDLPVRKPYKDSFSESYNYMLLLPFFQWLAPHLFPQYEDKHVKADTYNKVVVERMKNFVEGKIF